MATATKKKPAKKPAKRAARKVSPSPEATAKRARVSQAGRALLREAIAEITPQDQAAFAVLCFTHPESMTDEIRSAGCEATFKFAHLGWAAYHQLDLAHMKPEA